MNQERAAHDGDRRLPRAGRADAADGEGGKGFGEARTAPELSAAALPRGG
ncbi:hypothetical protein [Streptomyces sp. AC550_RSS872]|nr:hypothetical protein [Streptomyces sp. AC550_RSS872]